eukprot:CAMPEP_0118679300 /NCGR_PEP_ID=MMETSP0800-20121206/3712_1 /TAXON_ID=210618 ORGANISM="Striatella unipunctata, Strain CCMP2910" /NCGR_SAMPLE_ID=MMETSP0800 /ASSEMBLY_ACC=CAM_ASM_000638 /LENGTH=301 /DNA_ID=CAMNT_0006575281 /DNA_START=54 /DNA_END=959 /DNA_ORIENTATION=+
MKLSDWIDLIRAKDGKQVNQFYLKDWHLQLDLESHGRKAPYNVPMHFQHDLLNGFLTSFTSGDYRFVYWGPKDSFTSLHSDVLQSFSWSVNVVGEKLWTFYPPVPDKATQDDKETRGQFSVIQKAGQAIFVPSGWKHEVKNLKETLSINHNWITSSSLDLCWDCILAEIGSVENELKSWGICMDDIDTAEKMLRGSCGLDVTGFLLMLLNGLIQNRKLRRERISEQCDWQAIYDEHRIIEMIASVAVGKEGLLSVNCMQPLVSPSVRKRLGETLKSDKIASNLIECIQNELASWSSTSHLL